MKNNLINEILASMSIILDEDALRELKKQLYIHLSGYSITKEKTELREIQNDDYYMIEDFMKAKSAAGKAEDTVCQYERVIKSCVYFIGKRIVDINEDDIRNYLNTYQKIRKVSNSTMKVKRAYLSSFFSWLRKNRYIRENPMDLVDNIHAEITVKLPYTDEEMVALRDKCKNARDLAMIDFMNSSMVRVAELVKLNREDIKFTDRECIVFGKGKKERIVFFDGPAKIHLKEYLDSRNDDNPALFVSLIGKHERLSIRGVQERLKKIGKEAKVKKVHPHKFRRTGATRCLERGMPLEAIQELLGHSDIKTTQLYARQNRTKIRGYFNQVYA